MFSIDKGKLQKMKSILPWMIALLSIKLNQLGRWTQWSTISQSKIQSQIIQLTKKPQKDLKIGGVVFNGSSQQNHSPTLKMILKSI